MALNIGSNGKDEVSSFLWGWEADDMLSPVYEAGFGIRNGFKTRFKHMLEKHGATHDVNSNCRITWYHDGHLVFDCKVESISGNDGKVENYMEAK